MPLVKNCGFAGAFFVCLLVCFLVFLHHVPVRGRERNGQRQRWGPGEETKRKRLIKRRSKRKRHKHKMSHSLKRVWTCTSTTGASGVSKIVDSDYKHIIPRRKKCKRYLKRLMWSSRYFSDEFRLSKKWTKDRHIMCIKWHESLKLISGKSQWNGVDKKWKFFILLHYNKQL